MKVFKIAVMFILTLAMITTATGANSLAQGAAYDSLSVDDIRDQPQHFSEEPLIVDFSELSEDEFALLVSGLSQDQEIKPFTPFAEESYVVLLEPGQEPVYDEEPLIIDFSELSEDEFALLVKGLFHNQEMKTSSSNVAVNSRYIISNVSFDFRNPPYSPTAIVAIGNASIDYTVGPGQVLVINNPTTAFGPGWYYPIDSIFCGPAQRARITGLSPIPYTGSYVITAAADIRYVPNNLYVDCTATSAV